MASNTNWPGMTRLRKISTYYGHAMSIGWVKLPIDGCGICTRNTGPRHAFAQGRIMPISRGSPPFYDS